MRILRSHRERNDSLAQVSYYNLLLYFAPESELLPIGPGSVLHRTLRTFWWNATTYSLKHRVREAHRGDKESELPAGWATLGPGVRMEASLTTDGLPTSLGNMEGETLVPREATWAQRRVPYLITDVQGEDD